MTGPAVAVRGLTRSYGTVAAVRDVCLEVAPGEIYALLGLNGAGKTTLMRLLLGMVRPGAGSITILGRGVRNRTVLAEVGYLVAAASAYPELTVRENLDVARRLRRLPARTAVDDAVELFGLGEYADRRARHLSQGNLQRLALARALLHRPSLVVLDEPVNGLDPAGVVEVRLLLRRLAGEHGTTVLLSSHVLGEVARVATRIGVLHRGKLVEEFATAALPDRVPRRLAVTTRDDARALRVLAAAGFPARRQPGGVVVDGDAAVRRPDAVATALVRAGVAPTGLTVVQEDLEAYFLRLVGPAGPGAGSASVPGELAAAVHAEALKLRRSRVPWATAGAVVLVGLVGAFFMFVLQDLDRARGLGLLGSKSQLTGGSADWPGYFSLTAQAVSVGGLVVFGTAAIWLFGREFSDRTATDLLALPTSRTAVVMAKLLLGLLWCLLLTVLLVVVVLLLGGLLRLPGWSAEVALQDAGQVLGIGALTAGLAATYGLAASVGRGYLPAVGVLLLTVLAAQVLAAVGHGAWFPWAVPALLAGTAGPEQTGTGWLGPAAVVLAALGSSAATAAWWERADHAG